MITRETMFEPVLSASPGFRATWEAIAAESPDEPDGLPTYLVLSELARHAVRLHEQGSDSELRDIFSVVEAWHVEGDPYVKEAATIGFLEALQNTNVVGVGLPEVLLDYLGPESKRWWEKVEAFWEKGEIIRDT